MITNNALAAYWYHTGVPYNGWTDVTSTTQASQQQHSSEYETHEGAECCEETSRELASHCEVANHGDP